MAEGCSSLTIVRLLMNFTWQTSYYFPLFLRAVKGKADLTVYNAAVIVSHCSNLISTIGIWFDKWQFVSSIHLHAAVCCVWARHTHTHASHVNLLKLWNTTDSRGKMQVTRPWMGNSKTSSRKSYNSKKVLAEFLSAGIYTRSAAETKPCLLVFTCFEWNQNSSHSFWNLCDKEKVSTKLWSVVALRLRNCLG